MKTKFLFSTLAMAAAFSACTQDEIAVNNENVGSFDEVVGAKLLGEGFSVYTQDETGSRIVKDENGLRYSEGDKVAVAWVVGTGSVSASQTGITLGQVYNTVYANHMLVHGGDSKGFESRSNVYEGWHFAYAPFQYMTKPQQLTNIVVNPDFKGGDLDIDYLTNAPQFSNAAFVGEEQVNLETGKVDQNFPLQVAVNAIYPTLKPAAQFKKELLKDIKIQSVTLSVGAGNDLFTNSFSVVPSKLAQIDYNEVDKVDNAVIDETYFAADKAFRYNALSEETTVNVAEANFTLGDDASQLRIFFAPTQDAAAVDYEELSLRVNVEGGYFLINAGTATGNNKTAFEKIFKMLKGTEESGKKLAELSQIRTQSNLTFDLLAEDFHTDFTIDSYEKWVSCVNLANALDREGTVFEIAPNAEILFPAGEMLVPTKPVNVTCSQPGQSAWLAITGETTWTEGLGTVGGGIGIKVKDGGKLTVDDFVATSAMTIEEGGVLDAKATANVKFHSGSTVINNQGRILVEYGANLTMSTTKANNGVVAYTVDGKETVAQILRLIAESGNAKGRHSHVNTFIINSPIEWNMLKTEVSGGYEDPYQDEASSTVTYPAGTFDEISFEINGGSVYAADGKEILVKNVTMNEGSLQYVNINGKLTATGDVNVTTDFVGSLDVEGENNATIEVNGNINGAVSAKNATIAVEAISGEVELNGNVTINDAEINNNVTIKSGRNTLNNVTINGTLTINAGATVELMKASSAIKVTNLVNNGTLISNNDINVTDVTLNPKSTTTLTDKDFAEMDWNKVIWYTGDYSRDKITLNGTVLKYELVEFTTALAAVQNGDVLKVNTDVQFPNWEDLNPNNKEYVLDLNGNTLTIESVGGYDYFDKDITIKNGKIVGRIFVQNITAKFENIVFETPKSYFGSSYPNLGLVYVEGGATVELKNCTFKTDARSLETESGQNFTLTVDNCTFNESAAYPYFNPLGASASVTIKNSTFRLPLGTDIEAGVNQFTLTGNTFEKTFDFTSSAANPAGMSSDVKAFINGVLNNNTWKGVNKVDAYCGGVLNHVNSAI